jgi:mono/diheme cytochrome c family protein
MILNIIVWLALVLLAIFFVWLVTRAWKSRRWFIKWPGVILSGLLALIVVLVSGLGAVGLAKAYIPSGRPVQQIKVEATPAQIQRGEHIAGVFCVGCHSTNGQMPLTGGVDMARDIPMPIGSMVSINLTPAGPLKNWSDGEIMRVLREGVDPGGRRLAVMSTTYTRYLSDEDLHALIAYLRSMPAVENPTPNPPDQVNFLGALVFGAGLVPDLPPVNAPIVAPPRAASAEYGKYILSYQDCRTCHGSDLNGGTSKVTPNGPPLRLIKGWTQEQFITTLRSGVNPDGHQLQSPMPWQTIGKMDDDELQAMYLYLKSLW